MLELLKFVLEKLDFIKLAEAIHRQRNRKAAAQLYLALIQAYEVLEIYRVLLDELTAALKGREVGDEHHHYYLNPSRVGTLLTRQASNLEVLDKLIRDLREELRIVDDEFAEMWAQLIPGKFGILLEAERLLLDGRLPVSEGGPENFPAAESGQYRSLWFTPQSPDEDRAQVEKYLYGWDGREKEIVDVNIFDGEKFYTELSRYLREEKPYQRLAELEKVTKRYRKALLEHFTLEDVLAEIGNVRRHS